MLRPRQSAQPQFPALVNSAHPSSSGLVFAAYSVGGLFYDAVSKQYARVSNTHAARRGVGPSMPSAWSAVGGIAGTTFAAPTGADSVAGVYTLLVVGSLEVNASASALFESAEATNGRGIRFFLDDATLVTNGAYIWCNNGNRTSVTGLGANSEQSTHCVVTSHDGTNARWYIGGKLTSTVANAVLPTADSARRTRINCAYTGAQTSSCAMVLMWNRVLSDGEIAAVYANPAGLLSDPRRRRRVIAVSGSPTGTVAYTNANDTSSASGTTTVVGTSAKTNAADTSSASGSVGGAVSGTSATTNAADTSSASGTTTVTGIVGATNASDISFASGWSGSISGTVAASNDADYSDARGSAGSAQTTTGGGNWYSSTKRKRAFSLPQKWTDDERRIIRGLPPVAVEIAQKKAKEAAQAQSSATEAMRVSVEALRAEVGKQKAAELRDDFVFIVRTMVEREVIEMARRQAIADEEEAIAMLSLMLAVS